jgi:hypothetical protein
MTRNLAHESLAVEVAAIVPAGVATAFRIEVSRRRVKEPAHLNYDGVF